jgi:Cu/Ag efflux pump CusA
MTSIFERVSNALAALTPAVPYGLAPYLSADGTLPDTFLAYQLVASPPEQHADDAETERSYLIQVSIYSRSGLSSLPDVDGVMTAAGFQKGNSRQLLKDPETGHFGLAKEYRYLE